MPIYKMWEGNLTHVIYILLYQHLENLRKEERARMTVNNVNALSPFGAVQGGQTSVKPEEYSERPDCA